MRYFLILLGAYLIGCSSMAFYLSKIMKKNFRGNGSGNLGASNATVLLGWRAGILVGIHDIGKGILAVCLAKWLYPDLEYGAVAAGTACVLGHIFPFYLKFKGGKGLASFIGMTVALNWKLALAVVILLVVVTLITDYIVIGTVVIALTVPVAMGILAGSLVLALLLGIPAAVILYKHRENYVRIARETEIGLRSTIKGEHRMK